MSPRKVVTREDTVLQDHPNIVYDYGPHVLGTLLWFDPTKKRELCAVSNAGAALRRRQAKLLWSERTSKLVSSVQKRKVHGLVCPYHRPFSLGPLSIELYPSGYMLGAAQFQVTFPSGHKLVYSGPVASGRSVTAEARELPPCDTLILDSQYGDPRYCFPDQADVESQVLDWIVSQQQEGRIPVLLAANPGKAQDLLHLLGNNGHIPRVHRSIYQFKKAYLTLGVELPSCKQLRGKPEAGEVVIWPSSLQHSTNFADQPNIAFATLTGDGVSSNTHHSFEWSSRADYAGLKRYVKALAPQNIIVVGPHAVSLAEDLGKRSSRRTEALHDNPQLALI